MTTRENRLSFFFLFFIFLFSTNITFQNFKTTYYSFLQNKLSILPNCSTRNSKKQKTASSGPSCKHLTFNFFWILLGLYQKPFLLGIHVFKLENSYFQITVSVVEVGGGALNKANISTFETLMNL